MKKSDSEQKKVVDAVALRDRAIGRQRTFRSQWQSVADLMFPQTYGIATKHATGDELMTHLFDTTAVEELENMASGIANNLFPAGQKFFALDEPLGLEDNQTVIDYQYYLGEVAHEEIFNSNYVTQTSNTIKYWAGFGTGANYTDWTVKDGLCYRDYAIGTYQCLENSKGIVDTFILNMKMTARQVRQQFGQEGKSLGPSIENALSPNTTNQFDEFDILHIVRPREDRDPSMIDNLNMPWESIFINEKDRVVLQEGGFEEFPFAVPRYTVMYREVYGRGRGTDMLPRVRVINRLAKDYLEMSNKWVNPPLEVLDTFEGQVNVAPGAANYVVQKDSIRPLNMMANGAYPVTKDMLEYRREEIREGFFKNAFEPISGLSGDRRNQLEISERLREGLKKATRPFSRLFTELVTPQIERSILLLIRNRVVEPPPPELQGHNIKIRLINPLALALEDQQAKGGQAWMHALAEVEPAFPGIIDNVDSDNLARDLGRAFGAKSSHIKSVDQRDEERAYRAEQARMEQQMQAAQVASDAYAKTTKAPEQGSAAERL